MRNLYFSRRQLRCHFSGFSLVNKFSTRNSTAPCYKFILMILSVGLRINNINPFRAMLRGKNSMIVSLEKLQPIMASKSIIAEFCSNSNIKTILPNCSLVQYLSSRWISRLVPLGIFNTVSNFCSVDPSASPNYLTHKTIN